MKSPNKSVIQQRLEQRLARYVAMPTVATHIAACKEAIQIISGELTSLGFKTHVSDSKHPWVMATTRGNSKHVRVLLHAHFDVVTASDEQFVMRTDGDKLIGRGVFDMKFALTSYMEAITDILQQDELSAYNVGILVTTDEEIATVFGNVLF